MVQVSRTTFTVTPEGVGRPDYSINVEYSVEPTIRSYQRPYYDVQEIEDWLPGEARTINIRIPTKSVVIATDFCVSVPANILIQLEVYAVQEALVGLVVNKRGYGNVSQSLVKGFPFFETIRFVVTNNSNLTLDGFFYVVGFYTSETEYYLEIEQV